MTDRFISLADERYSCRSYSSAPVSSGEISALLEAARIAPSACNRQPWKFIVAGADDTVARQAILESYPREWVLTAPTHIIVCGVPSEAWVRPTDGHNHVDIDVAIATEHICLEATALGLASCWICNFDPAVLSSRLNLPEGIVPMVILPIGRPADNRPEKRRKPIADIILER